MAADNVIEIATFDGCYGRTGIICINPGKCDVCHQDAPAVIVIDGSDGEYAPGAICRDCAIKAFARILRPLTEEDLANFRRNIESVVVFNGPFLREE